MCGIFFSIWNSSTDNKKINSITKAFNLLNHRGPDNKKLIKGNNWSLGHTRLSIIDVNNRSNQPFTDNDKRYFLSFNGEIYNYMDIKNNLENKGIIFNTNSDTEVLFKSLTNYGLEKTLKSIRGMFSFIFFDSVSKTLYGAKDHLGQKPFHYSFQDNMFSVASEVPVLLELQSSITPDLISWRTYLCSNGIIEKDRTFFKNIKTLPSGHFLKFQNGKLQVNEYFNILELHDQNNNLYRKSNKKNTVEKLHFYIKQSIKRHSISDVPVGVLLSGGIDSSLIFKYTYDENKSVKTFTKISPEIEKIPKKTLPLLLKKFPASSRYIFQRKEDYLLDTLNFIIHTATPPRWGGGPPMAKVCKQAFNDGIRVLFGGDGVDESCAGYNSHKNLFEQFNGDFYQMHQLLDLDKNSPFYNKVILDYFLDNRIKERKKNFRNSYKFKK